MTDFFKRLKLTLLFGKKVVYYHWGESVAYGKRAVVVTEADFSNPKKSPKKRRTSTVLNVYPETKTFETASKVYIYKENLGLEKLLKRKLPVLTEKVSMLSSKKCVIPHSCIDIVLP